MYISQKIRFTPLFLLLPLGSLTTQTSAGSDMETLSYVQVLQRALAADPRLEWYTALEDAAEGQITQAGLRPNPVVGAELENFLGTGPLSGVDGLEISLGIRQLIETADKLEKRKALAEAERDLIGWERERILADIEASVRSAFMDVLLAQQQRNLRTEQLALAERSAEETARLVEAARSAQVEQARATLAVRRQQFALQQAERKYQAAKTVLSSYWEEEAHSDFSVQGEIRIQPTTPEFVELASKLVNTATLARYSAEERAREAALELEQARATPDVEVFAGSRYFNERNGDIGFRMGVEIPWPLFDKNQGNIRTARAQLRAVWQERDAQHRELLIALNRAYQQLLSAHAEAMAIQTELIPSAEATLLETEAGYERGQFTQLAVLQSRNTLFEVRESYLEAVQRYALAQAEIEALTRPAALQQ